MEERFQFRRVHVLTGTFVLLVLGICIVVVLMAGRSQRWFIRNVPLRIVLPESGAAGIRDGSEVYFLGTLMGTVSDVLVDPAGRMEAEVNIRRDFFRFIRVDSSATIKKKFGLGDSFFEIARGEGAPLSAYDASIVCEEPLPGPLESVAEEIRREAVPALKKLNAGLDAWSTLGTNLVETGKGLDQLIARASEIASNLQSGQGTAGRLLTDPAAANELMILLAKANRTMDGLQPTLTNLYQASGNVQAASTNLPGLGAALGNEARDLPGLVRQAQTSMREMERLVQAMQRHWLVRRYVDKTNPPSLRPLPAEEKLSKQPARRARSPKDEAEQRSRGRPF